MTTYSKPIALIIIASSSPLETQKLRESLKAEEYVFAETTNLYHCLDIAECHHPKAILLDFSLIENNYVSVIRFLHFLNIPIILLTDDISSNMMLHLNYMGTYAMLKKDISELELRRTLEIAIAPEQLDKITTVALDPSFDLGTIKTKQKTKLQDIVNNAIGTAVNRMSETISCDIAYEPPTSRALSPLFLREEIINKLGEKSVVVAQLNFTGNLSGSAQMLFSQAAADAIVLSLSGDDIDPEEFNQIKADIMGEIGNIAINSILGTFSNTLKYKLTYVVPVYLEGSAEEIVNQMSFNLNSTVILFLSHFKMVSLHVEGDFLLFFQARLLLDLLFRT